MEQRYNLIGSACTTCGRGFFPRRDFCPTCRRKGKIEEKKFSGSGEVFAHTTIYAPPEGFEHMKPYLLGIIKLSEGPLVTAQIVDVKPGEVEIGDKVKMVFRRIQTDGEAGIITYGYKFRLK